jgi:hypothetical protein
MSLLSLPFLDRGFKECFRGSCGSTSSALDQWQNIKTALYKQRVSNPKTSLDRSVLRLGLVWVVIYKIDRRRNITINIAPQVKLARSR